MFVKHSDAHLSDARPRGLVPTVHFPHTGEIVEGATTSEVALRLLEGIRLWVRRRDGHARRKPRLKHLTFNVWRAFEGFELEGGVRGMLFEIDALLSDSTRANTSRVRANSAPERAPGKDVAARRPVQVDAKGHLLLGFPSF